MTMAFRSHVFRPFDLGLMSNRLLFGMLGAIGAGAGYLWLTGDPVSVLWAIPQAFLVWAFTREIDPDNDWTALVAGAGAGLWMLSGRPGAPALAIVGFLMAARLVVNTSGRRPLTTDLIGLAVVAAAISYTSTGWVGGFGLALAIYIDDRMYDKHNNVAVASAAAAALGSSVVASLSGALPDRAPAIDPVAVAALGVLALIAILRTPPEPVSVVDSRMKFSIRLDRLHAGRSLSGILIFIAGALAGPDAPMLYPLAFAMTLALVSAEIRRR
jgi:hypothetical protein